MGNKSGWDSWLNIMLIPTFHLVHFKSHLHWEPPPFQSCAGKGQALETGNPTWLWGKGVVLYNWGGLWALTTRKGQYVSTLVAHCRSTQCSVKARLPKGVAKQVSWHTDLTDIFRSLKQIHKVKLFIDHWIFILLPLKELFLVAIL